MNILPWRIQWPVEGDRAKPGRHTQLTPLVLDKRIHIARMSHFAQFGSLLTSMTKPNSDFHVFFVN